MGLQHRNTYVDKANLTSMKVEMISNTIILGDFNFTYLLSNIPMTDHPENQKGNTLVLNDTLNQVE